MNVFVITGDNPRCIDPREKHVWWYRLSIFFILLPMLSHIALTTYFAGDWWNVGLLSFTITSILILLTKEVYHTFAIAVIGFVILYGIMGITLNSMNIEPLATTLFLWAWGLSAIGYIFAASIFQIKIHYDP